MMFEEACFETNLSFMKKLKDVLFSNGQLILRVSFSVKLNLFNEEPLPICWTKIT